MSVLLVSTIVVLVSVLVSDFLVLGLEPRGLGLALGLSMPGLDNISAVSRSARVIHWPMD